MAKRISETERLIGFALAASEDALTGAIQSLIAIRNNRFPVEKKARKPRKPKPEPKEAKGRKPAVDSADGEAVARRCTQCKWKGQSDFPEPCPECGAQTEVAK